MPFNSTEAKKHMPNLTLHQALKWAMLANDEEARLLKIGGTPNDCKLKATQHACMKMKVLMRRTGL